MSTSVEGFAGVLGRAFSAEALIVSVALAIPYALSRAVVPLGDGSVLVLVSRGMLLVYVGALASYYFQTVNHIGLGRAGLPFSSVETRADLASGVLRGLLCLAVGLGPGVATAILFGPPLSFVALLLGLLLVPASILAIVTSGSAVNGIWPPALASIIATVPAAYGKLAGTFVLSSVVYGVVMTLAGLTVGQVPLLGSFLVGIVSNLSLLAQALLVGRFLRRHATELGYR